MGDATKKSRKGVAELGDIALEPIDAPPLPTNVQTIDRPMTPTQIAKFLQISPASVRRQVAAGKLPFFRVGHKTRFLPSDVLRVLRKKS